MQIGDKIDSLTLVKILEYHTDHHKMGRFRCDCGAEIDRLISGIIKPGVSKKSCPDCRPKRKKTGGNKKYSYGFDNQMANSFIMGKM
jgi:hypothetical protein